MLFHFFDTSRAWQPTVCWLDAAGPKGHCGHYTQLGKMMRTRGGDDIVKYASHSDMGKDMIMTSTMMLLMMMTLMMVIIMMWLMMWGG